ncbi:MAG TPA: hypothetical protein VFS55_10770 [Dokdonella sp.]|nr:hypothetical protein [Dokdonella sp.]
MVSIASRARVRAGIVAPRPTPLRRALAAAWLVGGLTALPATAATIAVTTPDDGDAAATGTCTLRPRRSCR